MIDWQWFDWFKKGVQKRSSRRPPVATKFLCYKNCCWNFYMWKLPSASGSQPFRHTDNLWYGSSHRIRFDFIFFCMIKSPVIILKIWFLILCLESNHCSLAISIWQHNILRRDGWENKVGSLIFHSLFGSRGPSEGRMGENKFRGFIFILQSPVGSRRASKGWRVKKKGLDLCYCFF